MRIEELDTPAIVVDLDVVERNVQALSQYAKAHGLHLRPHTKTHKMPALARMQIDSGCSGITVAKTGEAEVMAAAGLDNILVHYPVYGDSKLTRLAQLAKQHTITMAVDSPMTASAISQAASAAGSTINLLVEFDSGMRRCGVETPDEVESLAQDISALPNVRFAGITTYPGHIWTTPDEQSVALAELSERFQRVLHRLQQSGFECEVVSAGSTPTARNSHLVKGLTEIRPGTYIFNDRNTVGVGACTLADCALRVVVTVVSTAVPGRAIVDGGSKTFSSDRWISGLTTSFGHIVEQPDVEFVAMSEEHGHLDVTASSYQPAVGDKLTIIPNHVCACVNLHDSLTLHRGGIVEKIRRVAGRGHVR